MKIYKKNKDLVYTFTDEETIILEPETGDFFELNKTGTIIFKLIDGIHSENDILKLASKKLGVKEIVLKNDLKDFLKNLHDKKIIMVLL